MHQREPSLERFLVSLNDALLAKTAAGSPAREVTEKIFGALQSVARPATPEPCRFSVCEMLDEVVDTITATRLREGHSAQKSHTDAGALDSTLCTSPVALTSSVVEHAQSLLSLSDSLAWWQRADATKVGEPFESGHANATIVGPRGLEEREDVWVGVSLIAPGIDYPVHHHPPEEVYLVLSEGHWNQNNGSWQEPGIGGIVHNPPNILHAMRSGEKPLLATWCLWIG